MALNLRGGNKRHWHLSIAFWEGVKNTRCQDGLQTEEREELSSCDMEKKRHKMGMTLFLWKGYKFNGRVVKIGIVVQGSKRKLVIENK